MSEMEKLLAASCTAFCASFLQGFAGFGFSPMFLGLTALFLPTKQAVALALLLSVALNVTIIHKARKHVQMRKVLWLLAFALIGMPLGVAFLKFCSPILLKTVLGIGIVFFALTLLLGWRAKTVHEKIAAIPVGILSGFLNGALTISGPPVILFFSNMDMPKVNFRANLATYFLLLSALTVPAFVMQRLIDLPTTIFAAELLPAIICGTLTGNFVSERIGDDRFARAALLMLTVLGIWTFVSAFFST